MVCYEVVVSLVLVVSSSSSWPYCFFLQFFQSQDQTTNLQPDFFFAYTRTPRISKANKIIAKLNLTLYILTNLQQIQIDQKILTKIYNQIPDNGTKNLMTYQSRSITPTSALFRL